jgi:hypothetical protein
MHIFWFAITKQFWKVHALHLKLCFLHLIWHHKLAVVVEGLIAIRSPNAN